MRTPIEFAWEKAFQAIKDNNFGAEMTFVHILNEYKDLFQDAEEKFTHRLALIHLLLSVDGDVKYKIDKKLAMNTLIRADSGLLTYPIKEKEFEAEPSTLTFEVDIDYGS